MTQNTYGEALKAQLPDMPDHLRYALESRLGNAERLAAKIADEALQIRDALRAMKSAPEDKQAMITALLMLCAFADSAQASGGIHSAVVGLTTIAGSVEILSHTGALQSPR